MRKLASLGALLLLGMLSYPLEAQYNCGTNLELQFAPMNVWGNDISREYVEYGGGFTDPISTILIVNERREPVSIATGRGIALRGEFVKSVNRKCEWFLGLRGWLFSGVASIDDTVRFDPNLQGLTRGVRMWDSFYFQNDDYRNEGGVSEIRSYSGSRTFAWNTDILAVRRLGASLKTSSAVTFGLRVGSANFTEVNFLQNEGLVADVFGSDADSTENLDLYLFLWGQSQSEVRYNTFLGPLFGFGGTVTEGKMHLRGSFNQGFVFGNAYFEGQWMDDAELWFVKEVESGELSGIPYSRDGRLSPLSGKERLFLPITEMSLDVSFSPRKRITLGGGVFVSAWFNAPTPDRFSINDFSWVARERTLKFVGITTIAIYRF